MRRLQRIVAELLAFFGLWFLWDFRIAATLALILIVVHALQTERSRHESARRAEPDLPVLTTPADAALPGGRQTPGSGQI